jgi:hypothetical protein
MDNVHEYNKSRTTSLIVEVTEAMVSCGIKFDRIPAWLMKEQMKPSSCGYCIVGGMNNFCACPSVNDDGKMVCEVLAEKNPDVGRNYAFFRTSVMNEPHESNTRRNFIDKATKAIKDAKHDVVMFKRTYNAIRRAHG